MGSPGAAGAGAATGRAALAGGGGTPAGGSGGGDAARAIAGRGLFERDAERDRACSDWMNGSTSGWSLRATSSKSTPSRGWNCFFVTRRWN